MYTLTRPSPDLIRHGKNHTTRQHDDQAYGNVAQQAQQQVRDRSREQPRAQQQQQIQKTHVPKYQEELERIVQEEREAKETMPTYEGLEGYRLVEKMGECVSGISQFD